MGWSVSRAGLGVLVGTAAMFGAACSALFEDPTQCATDADCARFGIDRVCAPDGVCISASAQPGPVDSPSAPYSAIASGSDASSSGSTREASADALPPRDGGVAFADGADVGVEAAPVLASIAVSPGQVDVHAASTQQFTATALDDSGNPLSSQPTFAWSVTGGGSIDQTGLFTAGNDPGGPFTVSASAESFTGTATVSVAVTTITIGETNILSVTDSNNADYVLAQEATLATPATIRSLSFYVDNAAGLLRLGIYDATGPNGGPGSLEAATAEFVPVAGWNPVPVISPTLLPAGTHWLAYAPSDNTLSFRRAGDGTGNFVAYSVPYGPLSTTFSPSPTTSGMDHWSFYATLTY
jgi:hypothetical protein